MLGVLITFSKFLFLISFRTIGIDLEIALVVPPKTFPTSTIVPAVTSAANFVPFPDKLRVLAIPSGRYSPIFIAKSAKKSVPLAKYVTTLNPNILIIKIIKNILNNIQKLNQLEGFLAVDVINSGLVGLIDE